MRTPALKILAVRQLPPRAPLTAPRTNGAARAPHDASAARSLHDVVATPEDGAPPLTLDELLTGWLSSLGASLEPDSFAEYGDYAKHVERLCRAQHAAEALCRAFDRRMDDWARTAGDGGISTDPDPAEA